MQFEKKTRIGSSKGIVGILIKIILILLILIFAVILVDRINFPSPIKKIEKIISNENFKVVK
tara:strand:+ start:5000 stop:5185 length:186 start_codon:yes stop_codon:yes gene_type:complete